MTVKSAPFYWVECDAEGCDNTYPGPGDEYAAWQDPGIAEDLAREADWQLTEDKRLLCLDCHIALVNAEAEKVDP